MIPDECEVDREATCCANCRWFDPRPCFCRLNPPVPMSVSIGGYQVTTSNFPKINIPSIDWCSNFEPNVEDEEEKQEP